MLLSHYSLSNDLEYSLSFKWHLLPLGDPTLSGLHTVYLIACGSSAINHVQPHCRYFSYKTTYALLGKFMLQDQASQLTRPLERRVLGQAMEATEFCD